MIEMTICFHDCHVGRHPVGIGISGETLAVFVVLARIS
jgi:hypothetical protein